MNEFEKLPLVFAVIVACLFFCSGCSKRAIQRNVNNDSGATDTVNKRLCEEGLNAGQKTLGKSAEIVRCGAFNNQQTQEAVVALRVNHAQSATETGLAFSQLVILRHEASGWRTVLTASKQIRNEAGFVGIDFIDDSAPFYGYRVLFPDQRDDGKKAFTLSFTYLGKDENTEGIPLEISWDSSVGRYREFNVNSDPSGFKPEIQNPPHLKH